MRCDICQKRRAVVMEGLFFVCLKCQAALIRRRIELKQEAHHDTPRD